MSVESRRAGRLTSKQTCRTKENSEWVSKPSKDKSTMFYSTQETIEASMKTPSTKSERKPACMLEYTSGFHSQPTIHTTPSQVIISLTAPTSMLRPLNRIDINPLLHHLPQRAQLPQKRHPLLNSIQHIINLLIRREPSNTKSNTAVGALVAVAESPEDVTRFERGRGTSTAGGESDVFQGHEEGFAFDVGKGDVDAAWVVPGWVAVQGGVLHC